MTVPKLIEIFKLPKMAPKDMPTDIGLLSDLAELGLIEDASNPKFLGRGDMGVVFTGKMPDTVVKVTTDPDEAKVMRQVLGKSLPGIVRVISVHNVTHGFAEQATAAVLEKLQKIPQEDQSATWDLLDDIEYNGDRLLTREQFESAVEEDPRLEHLLRSAMSLKLRFDLWGDDNMMESSAGIWTLADLGPCPKV